MCEIRATQRAARLLRDFDHFPPKHRRRIVLVQKGQAAREVRGLLGENGLACGQQQRQVQERNAYRVQADCKPCHGNDSAVLGVVAIERVVSPQEAGAIIKPLAVEGLEGARGDQREGEEHEVQKIWQSSNEPSLEVGGLALGEDLSDHATSQDKYTKHARRQHEEEQLVKEGAELQTAQRQAKRLDAQVQDVKHVEQRRDGCWHRDLEDALDACRNLCNAEREGYTNGEESDHLFERSPKLLQGLIDHAAQALAWLAPATPAEKEEHGQGDAYESCQRRCRCVPALHARRLTRIKVPRATGDVADSAVRPGGPWLAPHAISVCARCRVGRGRIGAAPQIGAVIV
eukprot:scaffold31688_cov73-Phaeocystis_antarctica.AAC.3